MLTRTETFGFYSHWQEMSLDRGLQAIGRPRLSNSKLQHRFKHLPVSDIEATSRFYSLIFDEPPVKRKTDYVKFLPRVAPLNISFHQSDAPKMRDLHLGFELSERAALDRIHARLMAAGLVRDERETSVCCYANQDKFWVTDPDGYKWEFYVLLKDTEEKIDRTSGCCASAGASASGCC